jgi:hypothetical protein
VRENDQVIRTLKQRYKVGKISKRKIWGFHRQEICEEGPKLPDNLIFNLKSKDDGELIRRRQYLKAL